MKTRKWFDYKDAATYLGLTLQEFYGLMRNKDYEMKDYLSTTGEKRMISKKGLELLRMGKTVLVVKYYKVKSLIK